MWLVWRNKRERSRRVLRGEGRGGWKREGPLIAFSPGQIEEHFQSKVEASPIGRPADLFSCLCLGGEDGLGTPWNGKKVSQSSELSGLSGFAITPQAS